MSASLARSPLDGLRCPPFGSGVRRKVSSVLTGMTSAGIPYQGFDYSSSVYDEYAGVATVRLGLCLPPFFVSLPENPREGVEGVQIPNQVGLLVVASDAAYGQAVLDGSLVAIREYARHRPLDLAIDGDSLTAIQVPLTDEPLRAYCEDMATVARSISANPSLSRFQIPREPGEGFAGYPGSLYASRDDRLLADAPITRNGDRHAAIDVIALAPKVGGLQAVAFTHSFQTSTYTGTTMVTQDQVEHLVSVRLPFVFGRIGIDWRGIGRPVMLFSPEFEEKHQVSAGDSEFAGDVIRPMLAWLTQVNPPKLAIYGSTMWFSLPTSATPQLTQWCSDFAVDFFARVAPAVWRRLGYPSIPAAVDLR